MSPDFHDNVLADMTWYEIRSWKVMHGAIFISCDMDDAITFIVKWWKINNGLSYGQARNWWSARQNCWYFQWNINFLECNKTVLAQQ